MVHGTPESCEDLHNLRVVVLVQCHRPLPVFDHALSFGPPEWLPANALDETYFRLLPSGQSTVTAEEAAMLAAVFGEDEPRAHGL
jgi:hypothetical protein